MNLPQKRLEEEEMLVIPLNIILNYFVACYMFISLPPLNPPPSSFRPVMEWENY